MQETIYLCYETDANEMFENNVIKLMTTSRSQANAFYEEYVSWFQDDSNTNNYVLILAQYVFDKNNCFVNSNIFHQLTQIYNSSK